MLFIFISLTYDWHSNMKGIEQFHKELWIISLMKEVPCRCLPLPWRQFCYRCSHPLVRLLNGGFVLELFSRISQPFTICHHLIAFQDIQTSFIIGLHDVIRLGDVATHTVDALIVNHSANIGRMILNWPF